MVDMGAHFKRENGKESVVDESVVETSPILTPPIKKLSEEDILSVNRWSSSALSANAQGNLPEIYLENPEIEHFRREVKRFEEKGFQNKHPHLFPHVYEGYKESLEKAIRETPGIEFDPKLAPICVIDGHPNVRDLKDSVPIQEANDFEYEIYTLEGGDKGSFYVVTRDDMVHVHDGIGAPVDEIRGRLPRVVRFDSVSYSDEDRFEDLVGVDNYTGRVVISPLDGDNFKKFQLINSESDGGEDIAVNEGDSVIFSGLTNRLVCVLYQGNKEPEKYTVTGKDEVHPLDIRDYMDQR